MYILCVLNAVFCLLGPYFVLVDYQLAVCCLVFVPYGRTTEPMRGCRTGKST
jgi:hypothetical protein